MRKKISMQAKHPLKETGQVEEDMDESNKDGSEKVQPIQEFGPRQIGMGNRIHVADLHDDDDGDH